MTNVSGRWPLGSPPRPTSAGQHRPTSTPGGRLLTGALVLAVTVGVAWGTPAVPSAPHLAAAPILTAPPAAGHAEAPPVAAAPQPIVVPAVAQEPASLLAAVPSTTAADPGAESAARDGHIAAMPTMTNDLDALTSPKAIAGWANPGALGPGAAEQSRITAAPAANPLSVPVAAPAAEAPAQGVPAASLQSAGLLPGNRILTYYGHPHDPNMGILGEYPKEDLLALLRAEAANYEAADPSRPVIPAFEVIATVAQGSPTQDGQYLLDTDLETMTEYADFAEANDILLFLDLQIGRNTVPNEIEKVRPLLERPHVHLALDPEFAIAEGQVPGTHIGELTAEQIGGAQEILAEIVRENGLPPKILVVHQFQEDMILGKERLAPVPGVQLVIESDGFGPPELKTEVYNILIRDQPVEFSGVKLFYQQDVPLMSPLDIVSLEPSPDLVIYQ